MDFIENQPAPDVEKEASGVASNLEKENDWVVARLENPSATLDDFSKGGLSADNTELKDISFYENNKYIQDRFRKEDGSFDKDTFKRLYDDATKAFNIFANEQYEKTSEKNIELLYDRWSIFAPDDVKTKFREPIAKVSQDFDNPEQRQIGIQGFNVIGQKTKSMMQIASGEKVFNTETEEWEDWSPNDKSLFKDPLGWLGLGSNPLVLASWDEDGFHKDELTGELLYHQKGEYKINKNGTFYAETLGTREVFGKQILNMTNYIIDADSALKKYDFIDSSGLDKSVFGTIMKTAAVLAPVVIGGPVGAAYSASIIGMQLMDMLPTLYKISLGVGDSNTPYLNKMQGISRAISGHNVSENSNEHMWSFENMMKLISDVGLQWGYQRAIHKGMLKALGTTSSQKGITDKVQKEALEFLMNPKNGFSLKDMSKIELDGIIQTKAAPMLEKLFARNNSIAAGVSLAHMSASQGFEFYEDAINSGVSRRDAAIGTWGTVIGMFGVNRLSGLDRLFLPNMQNPTTTAIAGSVKPLSEKISESYSKSVGIKKLNEVIAETSGKSLKDRSSKIFTTMRDHSKGFWEGLQTQSLGLGGKALGEGLEEVSEEAISDLMKATYNLANSLGVSENDVRMNAFEDAGERYLMNFLGGAVGGAMYYGIDAYQNRKTAVPNQTHEELIYHIRNQRYNDVVDAIKELGKNGQNGSTELSKNTYEIDGETYFKPVDENNISQNDYNTNQMLKYVEHLNTVINQEGLNISDEKIFKQIINAQLRVDAMKSLYNNNGDNFGDLMIDGWLAPILQDFSTLGDKIISARNKVDDIENKNKPDVETSTVKEQVNNIENNYTDKQKRTEHKGQDNEKSPSIDYLNDIKNAQQELDDLRKQREEFFSDENIAKYTDQMLFAINREISSQFFASNFIDYVEEATKRKYKDIPEEQLKSLKEQYTEYQKGSQIKDMKIAYDLFSKSREQFNDSLTELKNRYDVIINTKKKFNEEFVDINKFKETVLEPLGDNPSISLKEIIETRLNNGENIDALFKENMFTEEGIKSLIDLITSNKYMDRDVDMAARTIIEAYNSNNEIESIKSKLDDLYKISLTYKNFEDNYPVFTRKDINTVINPTDVNDVIQSIINDIDSTNYSEYSKILGNDLINDFYDEYDFTGSIDEALNAFPEIKTKLESYESEVVSKINESINESFKDAYSLINTLEQKLNNVDYKSVNPIYNFLNSMSEKMTGSEVDILGYLTDETSKLSKLETYNDYMIGKDRFTELEKIVNLLNMSNAVIEAAKITEVEPGTVFGINEVYNKFISNKDGVKEVETINDDMYNHIFGDLYNIRKKLQFLHDLHINNLRNQTFKHRYTSAVLNGRTAEIFKGLGRYKPLLNLEYKGIRLFGDESIDTPELNKLVKGETYNDGILYEELSKLADPLYDNFQKMLESDKTKSKTEILDSLFGNIFSILSESEIKSRSTSILNTDLQTLTDYDVLNTLLSSIAVKRSDFDSALYSYVNDESNKFAPLTTQELDIRMGTALAINPEVMNYSGKVVDGPYRADNMIFFNGSGGAGKTSAVASGVKYMVDHLKGEKGIYLSGPRQQQVDNLSQIKSNREPVKVTFDELMGQILGKEEYEYLKNDIDEYNTKRDKGSFKSGMVEIGKVDYTLSDGSKYKDVTSLVLSNNFKLLKPNTDVELMFVDEATHMNFIYSSILSKWAVENNIKIIALGDDAQNGYNKNSNIFGLDSSNILTTPKLNVSLRISNDQKAINDYMLNNLVNLFNEKEIIKKVKQNGQELSVESLNKEFIANRDNFMNNFSLRYYEDSDVIINGTKVVDSLDSTVIQNILDKTGELNYVYSDRKTDLYKQISAMASTDNRIKMYSKTEVQGSEGKYFIIDVDFTSYSKNDMDSYFDFLTDFYTMATRDKEGAYVINRGVTDLITPDSFIQDKKKGQSQDNSLVFVEFKNMISNNVEYAKDIYSKDKYNPDGQPIKKDDSDTPEPPKPPVKDDNGNNDVDSDGGKDKEVDTKPVIFSPITPQGSTNSSDLAIEVFKTILGPSSIKGNDKITSYTELNTTQALNFIRSYAWYTRLGMEVTETGKYKFHNEKVMDSTLHGDMNMFIKSGESYTKDEINELAANTLLKFKRRLLNNQKIDTKLIKEVFSHTDFKNVEESLDENYWNSGEVVIHVKKNNIENGIDDVAMKHGYDSKQVGDIAYNIEYIIPPKTEGGVVRYITLGTLSKADTWRKNADTSIKGLSEKIDLYENWRKDASNKLITNGYDNLYYSIDQVNYSKDTVLKYTEQPYLMFNRQTTNPSTMFSNKYYIYGPKSISEYKKLQTRIANETGAPPKSSINGKMVTFVTSDSGAMFSNASPRLLNKSDFEMFIQEMKDKYNENKNFINSSKFGKVYISDILDLLDINDMSKLDTSKTESYYNRTKGIIFTDGNTLTEIDGDNMANLYMGRNKLLSETTELLLKQGLSDLEVREIMYDILPPKIRMLVADPVGIYSKNFFNINFKKEFKDLDIEQNAKNYPKLLSTYGTLNDGAKIIMGLHNHRVNLKRLIDIYNAASSDYASRGELLSASKFNEMLDSVTKENNKLYGIYAYTHFRVTDDKDISIVKGDKYNSALININQAKDQFAIIDSLLTDMYSFLHTTPIDKNNIIKQSDVKFSKIEASLDEEFNNLDSNKIIVNDGGVETVIEGFNKNRALKVSGLIAMYYKATKSVDGAIYRYSAHNETLSNFNIIDIANNVKRVTNGMTNSDISLNEVFSNAIDLALHGRIIDSETVNGMTYDKEIDISLFAPFSSGIKNKAIYHTSGNRQIDGLDFYEALPQPKNYYSKMAIENGPFSIDFDTKANPLYKISDVLNKGKNTDINPLDEPGNIYYTYNDLRKSVFTGNYKPEIRHIIDSILENVEGYVTIDKSDFDDTVKTLKEQISSISKTTGTGNAFRHPEVLIVKSNSTLTDVVTHLDAILPNGQTVREYIKSRPELGDIYGLLTYSDSNIDKFLLTLGDEKFEGTINGTLIKLTSLTESKIIPNNFIENIINNTEYQQLMGILSNVSIKSSDLNNNTYFKLLDNLSTFDQTNQGVIDGVLNQLKLGDATSFRTAVLKAVKQHLGVGNIREYVKAINNFDNSLNSIINNKC